MAIKRCTCKNEYMDKKYGKGKRVFNEYKTQNGTDAKCTVCGTTSSGTSGRR